MNINELDLNLLRIFQTVAEERSVSRAAIRLDMSQPAVSNALKRFRIIMEDQLLVRGAGGMHLTPRGADLAQHLSGVLQGIEVAMSGGSEIDPTRITEPIIIICADEEILLHGADILLALKTCGCPAPVQFLPLNMEYRSDVLWRKRLAVTMTTMLYAPDGLKQRKLYDEELACLLRSDHPAAAHLDLEAYLASEHLLVAPLGGAPTGYLDTWFREQGKSRHVSLITHTFGSAPTLVQQAGLIATLPSRQANLHRQNPAFTVAPFPTDVPAFSLHLFWSERYDRDPVNKWLRDLLHDAITAPQRDTHRQNQTAALEDDVIRR
ncbi:LysR family transcriptional regulator [Primorskyibacter sp. S187A]|uniref:LysR family transcriptional regulator n=1 Tax=Primorskyibacter sp. S187A TaxID=3415130 RepID=UPI003C7A2AF1